MKARSVLSFLLLSILGLALLGAFFPANGIIIAGKTLRFVSPRSVIALDSATLAQLKLKEQTQYLNNLKLKNKTDSLKVYKEFAKNSPSRIYYPKNNPAYFHNFFQALDSSQNNNIIVRIAHYGDSQLEMDRISDVFRAKLQEKFGGNGTGIIPAIQAIPTRTVVQYASGNLSRHAVNDSTRIGVRHRRYGIMGMFSSLNGTASINFKTSKSAYEKTKTFTSVKMLVRNNGGPLFAKLKAGSTDSKTQKIDSLSTGLRVLEWNFTTPQSKGELNLQGNADIYGISLEGNRGVVVDNIALRGSSGEFYVSLDSLTFASSLKKMNTRLILLQFGGNAMPVIRNQNRVDFYAKIMSKQIHFLKNSCPNAQIMFIGPSDMSQKINGKLQTRPFLPELNEALKKTALENGIAYWDLYNTMGGKDSMVKWVKAKPSLASSDYTHFTQNGANTVGEMLYTSLYNDYQIFKLDYQLSKLKNVNSNNQKKKKS
jgi:lysophospholipase L1-like esterase